MSRSQWRILMPLVAVLAALFLVACGSDDDSGDEGDTGGTPATTQSESGGSVTDELFAGSATENIKDPAGGEKGGTITILSGGDVDYMDPGKTYYTYAIGIMNALHRGLYAYEPGSLEPTPDLADGAPEISEDGKTVTVKLKEGVMFSKPVNRAVTSADVKYAIERAFTANVANGYAPIYFGDLVGAPKDYGDYKEIPGVQTPDDQTLVMKFTQGTGAAAAGALAMPISIPIPKEYAEEYDAETPSTYGEQYGGLHGPVHDRVRRSGQGDRLRARQEHPHHPQPRLRGGRRGLPSRVRRRVQHRGRQRGRLPSRPAACWVARA